MEKYAFEICRRLSQNNDVTVISSGNKFDEVKIDRLKIIRVPESFRVSNTPLSFRLPLRIRRYIGDCDVIYAHTPVPFFADISIFISELFSKKPSLLVYHSGEVRGEGFTGVLAKIYRIWERVILQKVTCTVGVSEFVREKLNTDEVITPGVDPFYKPVFKEKLDKIIFVGQLRKGHEWKGLDLLLKSFSRIVELNAEKDVKLTIVGDGDLKEHYMQIARKLSLNVDFKGYLSEEKLIEEYSSSKLIVLPSKSDQESFGMVLLEANACGTGAVGTNVGGIPYYIREGKNGYLSDLNEKSLSEKIVAGIENYKKIGKLGEKISRKYDWNKSARKTEKLLEGILE